MAWVWVVMYEILEFLGNMWALVKPYRDAVFGLSLLAGGGFAAFKLGYAKQSRRPEVALSDAASRSRAMTLSVAQLHSDDREILLDLTRAARRLTTAVQDQADAWGRAGRSGNGGGGRGAEVSP